jgi:hypothetical protein
MCEEYFKLSQTEFLSVVLLAYPEKDGTKDLTAWATGIHYEFGSTA